MTQSTVIYLCLAGVFGMLVLACAPSSRPAPSTAFDPQDETRLARRIHSRTSGVQTLAAVLAMQFSGPERQGTVELVVNYDASGRMRFSAFKNLVITTRPIFDLLFVGETYRLELHGADGVQLEQGRQAAFVRRHPHFRAFYIIGEGFFLPGFDARGRPPALVDTAAWLFSTRLESGVTARWFVEPATLDIARAQIEAFLVEYGDYRTVGTHSIPGRVILTDQRMGFTSRTVVKQVEINRPLPPGTFDTSPS